MSHFDPLKLLRDEVGVSKHLPLTHLNSPTIFESSNSMIGSTLKLEGVTFEAELDAVLNRYSEIWHRALMALDDRFCVLYTIHRHQESMHLRGNFDNEFAKNLDQDYHAQFRNSALYTNDLYLTLIYKGVTSGKMGKGLSFLNRLSHKAIKGAREMSRLQQIKHLGQACEQVMTMLKDFKPRLLGENDQALGYSELLSFLSLVANAGDGFKIPFSESFTPIGKSILDAKKVTSLYPHGRISQYLPRKRIFFGDYIQFQGNTKSETRFAAMVTIKRYGQETASILLDRILHLDSELIATHSYAIESKDIAQKKMETHIRRMRNVGDKGVSQIDFLSVAEDLLASEQISMGYHHNTVMLIASNISELEQKVNDCIKAYADSGFVAIRETIGQEPAFWAQIPTNLKYIARSSLITSQNFVDFASLHNYRTGYIDGNHLGSAVTILETPSKTPYRFNFHIRGSKDNPSKGHTIIVGGNGSGKTVLMNFMSAQANRYGGYDYKFDRDQGCKLAVLASEGAYATLSPDFPQETQFAPLQLPDTPSNREFNRDLLIHLCKEKPEDELDARTTEELTRCVSYAYEDLALEHRTLTNATRILALDFKKWSSLRKWLRGEGKYPEGSHAYLFDNQEDCLRLQKRMGFDMTYFLDKEPLHIRTPVMMYLFHRIDLSLTGELTSVNIDEAWQNLQDPYWQGKLRQVYPTWRKKNAFLTMATQSPSSIVTSPIRKVILDNVATQIYFANPQATEEDYIDGLKLTDSEFQIIRQNPPESRLFLVKQEHESIICKLNLGHLPNALLILSGNEKTTRLADRIRSEVGNDPKLWLPVFVEKWRERSS